MTRSLLSAVKSGDSSLAKTLLTKGLYANIDAQDPRKDGTALFWACTHGLIEIVHLLILKGADMEARTAWDATPLHNAADHNELYIAKLLIRHGVNVNGKTLNEDTPCHLAAYRGYQEMVELLVESGQADLTLTNNKNRTPLDVSINSSHSNIANYIQEMMLRKNCNPVFLSDRRMTETELDLTEFSPPQWATGDDWDEYHETELKKMSNNNNNHNSLQYNEPNTNFRIPQYNPQYRVQSEHYDKDNFTVTSSPSDCLNTEQNSKYSSSPSTDYSCDTSNHCFFPSSIHCFNESSVSSLDYFYQQCLQESNISPIFSGNTNNSNVDSEESQSLNDLSSITNSVTSGMTFFNICSRIC